MFKNKKEKFKKLDTPKVENDFYAHERARKGLLIFCIILVIIIIGLAIFIANIKTN